MGIVVSAQRAPQQHSNTQLTLTAWHPQTSLPPSRPPSPFSKAADWMCRRTRPSESARPSRAPWCQAWEILGLTEMSLESQQELFLSFWYRPRSEAGWGWEGTAGKCDCGNHKANPNQPAQGPAGFTPVFPPSPESLQLILTHNIPG